MFPASSVCPATTMWRINAGKSHFTMFDSTGFWKYRSELVWVVVGQILALVGNIAAIKVLTSIIGIDGYGELALGMTIAGFQNLLIYGPSGQYILRYFGIYMNTGRLALFYRYMGLLQRTIIGVTALSALIVSLGLLYLACERWIALLCAAMFYGIVSGISTSLLSVHGAMRHRKITALHQGADVWLRTGFACALTYLMVPRASVAILGYCAATVIISISQWGCLTRSGAYSVLHKSAPAGKGELKSLHRDFLSFGAPFVYFSLFSIFSSYGDRWLIQGFCGLKEVGIYAILCQIANAPINIIMGIVSQLTLPIIYDKAGAGLHAADISECNRFLSYTFGITALVMGLFFAAALMCGRYVLAMASNNEVADHMLLFSVIMSAAILFNLGQLLTTRGMFQNRPNVYTMPKGIQAVSVIMFGLILVKTNGVMGMGISLALSSLLYLVAVSLINRYRLA